MKWNRTLGLWCALFMATPLLYACGDDNGNGMTGVDDPPAAVTNVAATATGQTIDVSWSPSAGADDYRIVLSKDGEADRENTATGTSSQFTGLTPATTYLASVYARNSVGSSAAASDLATTDEIEESFVRITDDILSSTTWTNDKVWVLTQPIFVGMDCGADGNDPDCVEATLTIEPGTTIVGETDLPQGVRGAYLVVSRGSQLIADANANRTDKTARPNADDVIVFTSGNPMGQRDRGDWGGLVINGRAPTNQGLEATGEGDSGFYGGTDPEDDSGILRGVRIEFAGDRVTPTDELNGLAPQGVGAGTTISYVQIAYNVDDGTEPFGGTVSMDHIVLTGIGDDSMDGTDGWRGFAQFVIAQQRGDEADQGFELSNDDSQADAAPHSTGVIANATMIGADQDQQSGEIGGPNSDFGLMFREGSHYRVYNAILRDFGSGGFCVENATTVQWANNRLAGQTDPQTTLSAEGIIVWNNATADGGDANFSDCGGYTQAQNKAFFETAGFSNMVADPMLRADYNIIGSQSSPPDIIASGVPAGYTAYDVSSIPLDNVNLFAPTDGRMLEQTDYPGAVEPGTALEDAWYYGWTMWSIDGSDSRPNDEGN